MFRTKEPYILHKRVSFVGLEKECHSSKEPCQLHKRALNSAQQSPIFCTQKSPIHCTKEPYILHTKETYTLHKRALYSAHKRALYAAQKSPMFRTQAPLTRPYMQCCKTHCTKEPCIPHTKEPYTLRKRALPTRPRMQCCKTAVPLKHIHCEATQFHVKLSSFMHYQTTHVAGEFLLFDNI